jgi:hypothetical protein
MITAVRTSFRIEIVIVGRGSEDWIWAKVDKEPFQGDTFQK